MTKKSTQLPIGYRCGRLVVLKKTERLSSGGGAYYLCKCDCGNFKEVWGTAIRATSKRLTKSCGCLQSEFVVKKNFKHGLTDTNTHLVWKGMHQRCVNSGLKCFKNYGGRGIKVCKRWNVFANFLKDMGQKPDGMTLDRINNDGDYKPSNCRWGTRIEQNNNTRRNVVITYQGKSKTIREWERDLGLPKDLLRKRIRVRGWSIQNAFSLPQGRWPK